LYTSVELCAGAGGQAIGLEQANFQHVALIDNDADACATLRLKRPGWNVVGPKSIVGFSDPQYAGIDLLAGGVPCPPFSRAGRQLGDLDERNLFPAALDLVELWHPRAVMFENVRGLLDGAFDGFRDAVGDRLYGLGYTRPKWKLLQASDYGVPQLRPRAVGVALKRDLHEAFDWPLPSVEPAPTVGAVLERLMAAGGWSGATDWAAHANRIAPTLVGGSKKHGGPDLGPTRAKREWLGLGVNGMGLANSAPPPDFEGIPQLTVEMAAALQGFPLDPKTGRLSWQFAGGKTSRYRQVGNAFPPPVARAVGLRIREALMRADGLSADPSGSPDIREVVLSVSS